MRYSSLLALCTFMLCLNVPEVRGEILAVHTYDIMTHTALFPKPVASDNTFSLAATWWLPDWQGSQRTRSSDDMGGGDIVKDDSDCMKYYNLYQTCPPPKLSTGLVHPTNLLTCQKSCYCPSEYIYSSSNCSGNYNPSGTACDNKYNACTCKAEFKYNSSNCSGNYQVAGTACGGNYNACICKTEFKYNSSNCSGEYQVSGTACDGKYNTCSPKPCSAGGYYAGQQADRICSAVTYGGRTCYSCYQPQCAAGGYDAVNNTSMVCSSVSYYGRTCYKCRAKTCAEQGKKDCNGTCIAVTACCGCSAVGQTCSNGTCLCAAGFVDLTTCGWLTVFIR